LVDQVGFSSHGNYKLIENAINSEAFSFCNLHLHFLDQSKIKLAQLALKKNMGVLAISPADKGGRLYSPSDNLLKASAPYHPLELAYRFLLSKGITTLSLGATKFEDFNIAKKLINSSQKLTSSEISALKNIDLSAFDSVIVGPGIGIDNDDWQKSKDYLIGFEGLLILDADALNRISESKLGANFFLERKLKTWITPHHKEFVRLFPNIKCETNVGLALKAANKFNISILLKGANSIIADNKNAWQLFGTDSQTARAGLGDLLSGFVAGSSAIDLTFCRNITTDFFAKYVLLHSFAASKCKSGSNASAIGDELSKIMRKRKTRQIS